jgi:hypothetical protein
MNRRNYLLAIIALGACGIYPDGRCMNESRSADLRANLAATDGSGATGSAFLGLHEERRDARSRSEEWVTYGVLSTLDRRTVSALHVHRASDVGHAAPLYTFPIKAGGADVNITVADTREPYADPTPFASLFDAALRTPLVVDVHTTDANVAALSGRATSTSVGWTRPFCS